MQNKNELLGEVWCLTPDCGEKMNVYLNKKKFLYGRCPSCGCQQQTGAKVQAYFAQHVPVGTLNDKDDHIEPVVLAEAIEEVESEEASETSEAEAVEATGGKGFFKIVAVGVAALGAALLVGG